MCSVIEIKNANEYYIHYHSPESMVTPTDNINMSDNKVLEDKNENSTGTNIGGKETEIALETRPALSPWLLSAAAPRNKIWLKAPWHL